MTSRVWQTPRALYLHQAVASSSRDFSSSESSMGSGSGGEGVAEGGGPPAALAGGTTRTLGDRLGGPSGLPAGISSPGSLIHLACFERRSPRTRVPLALPMFQYGR